MRGRKPTPTHLRLLRGNPSGRPINANEPKPEGDLDRAPSWLTSAQKRNWSYVIANAPPGLLKRLDRAALTAFVVAESVYRQAVETMATAPMLIPVGKRGLHGEHPALKIARQQAAIIAKIGSELGFTPASRPRIHIHTNAGDGDFDEFL